MRNKIITLMNDYKCLMASLDLEVSSDIGRNEIYNFVLSDLQKILDSEPSNLERMLSEFDEQKNIVDTALEESREYFSKFL